MRSMHPNELLRMRSACVPAGHENGYDRGREDSKTGEEEE